MGKSFDVSMEKIEEIYQRHGDMLYRLCFSYMKNTGDCEDAVQDTLIRLITKGPHFSSTEHEKAWLIVTATNVCKNKLKHWFRKTVAISESEMQFYTLDQENDQILLAVMNLPNQYKTLVYLYYYEGYSSVEIAKLLKKPQSTIRTQLKKARQILKNELEGNNDE